MRQKYFFYPFGASGDQTVIPDATQPSGSVSFQSGWPFNYQRQIGVDPLALPLDRTTLNWLMMAITEQLQQYQQFGAPEWISLSDNDGTQFAYDFGAMVRYSASGNPPFTTYVSLKPGNATNTDTPGATANWYPWNAGPGSYYTDTGAANAYVVALTPPVAFYVNGLSVSFKAAHANTSSCTLNAGPSAVPLVNNVGGALVSGDIPAGSIVNAVYDNASSSFWVVGVVPSQYASQSGVQGNIYAIGTAGGTADAITASFSPAITTVTNGMTLSIRASLANLTSTPTFTPNSGTVTAHTIMKGNGQPVAPGDISGAGHWVDLTWDSTLTAWILLNPAQGVVTTGRLLNVQIFKTPGTTTYTATPGTNSVVVEVQAAGAGGSGTNATGAGQTSAGGGGGAGGYAKSRITLGFNGVSVTVGAAGTAGTASSSGGVGGSSSFGSLVSAAGGPNGGTPATNASISINGGSVNSTLPTTGNILNVAGQGGNWAVIAANGSSNSVGGAGGASMFGPGGTSTSGSNTYGIAAVNYGAGGSGGTVGSSQAAAGGGAGANGIVIVWEYA